jgi:hypothetical protein
LALQQWFDEEELTPDSKKAAIARGLLKFSTFNFRLSTADPALRDRRYAFDT